MIGRSCNMLGSTGEPAISSAAPLASATLQGTTGSAIRLLLVEDNPVNQKVTMLLLKHLGYRVDLAQNGIEALDLASRHHYALILMDCLMPEMDGLETTRRIRSRTDFGAKVPIIAVTANAHAEDRQRCFAAGMDGYLAKPVRIEDLAEKLQQWLGRGTLDRLSLWTQNFALDAGREKIQSAMGKPFEISFFEAARCKAVHWWRFVSQANSSRAVAPDRGQSR